MSPEEWRVFGPLLDAALDTAPERRGAFIASACGDDVAMAEQMRRLIEECEREDPMLDAGASERFAFLLDEDEPPPMFPTVLADRYQMGREIGRGGMAIVFLAQDTTHDRPVAIKVMRPSTRSGSAVARFLSEIRVTAGLRHPHIVPLYDSGEADGSLYFIMPYYEAGTLAARLEREPQLPVGEALRIASDIAGALEYAHGVGLIHRDLKPSNILFSSGEALLGDFGVARLTTSANKSLTATGAAIGTPAYMSPEQAAGRPVDVRSDIYSLGCVLYEMLAGEPPTAAASREARARRGSDTLAPLRAARRSLAAPIEQCVVRAMALDPADRYASAADLATALGECMRSVAVSETPVRRVWRTVKSPAAGIVLAACAVAVAAVWISWRGGIAGTVSRTAATATPGLDTTRYVVLPYDYAPDVRGRIGGRDVFAEAISSWHGVSVVDSFKVAETLAKFPAPPLNGANARAVAAALGAGRYVRREISAGAGTDVMRVSVFDARTGDALVQLTNPVPGSHADSAFAAIAQDVLFPDAAPRDSFDLANGTHSRPALQAFLRGKRFVGEWDLARADSAFVDATRFDESFPQAHLWTAQVRVWRDKPTTTWNFEAERALAGRALLSASEQRLADVLSRYAAGDTLGACGIWSNVPSETRDFAAWYGAAECLRRDHAVVRDPSSPSKWRFRSSFNAAMKALQRAYQVLPATYRDFREDWYWSLATRLNTQPTAVRRGHALAPDTGRFMAYASWSATGDTIEFVPFRPADVASGRPGVLLASRGEAVRQQRILFRNIATTWRAAFPSSADALLAVAIALDQLGDRSAVDSAHAARALATDAVQRLRAGAAEVWLRVKLGVPSDVASLTASRLLADSLLRLNPHPDEAEAEALASLAALIGHAAEAASFAKGEHAGDATVPVSLQSPANQLLAFAALGGPEDSLRALETRIEQAIRTAGDAKEQQGIRARLLLQPMTLAFPTYKAASIRGLAVSDSLAEAEIALLDGDTTKVLRLLETAQARRVASSSPEDWKLDTLYPEAWLLSMIGQPAAAASRIGPTLDVQDRVDLHVFATAAGAGALVRSMALRAQLANRSSDAAGAAVWAKAVRTLWADADPFLQRTVVQEMAKLSR
jgi:eukaryotic-like serine/threonine-protein kinase